MAKQNGGDIHLNSGVSHNITISSLGRAYINGCRLSAERVIHVIKWYTNLVQQSNGHKVHISHVAKKAKVSWNTAKKLIDDYLGIRKAYIDTPNRPIRPRLRISLNHKHEPSFCGSILMTTFKGTPIVLQYSLKGLRLFFQGCLFQDGSSTVLKNKEG